MQSVKISTYVLRVTDSMTVKELRSIIGNQSLIQLKDFKDGMCISNVYLSLPTSFKFSVGQFATDERPKQKTR